MKTVPDDERTTGYLDECRKGLLRMANIVSELLVFSRNEYAEPRLKSLTEIITESVATFERRERTMRGI